MIDSWMADAMLFKLQYLYALYGMWIKIRAVYD